MHPQELSTTKIVATPTKTSWAQAYTAGTLFAVLSLTTEEDENLSLIGRDFTKALESEFFGLETKQLQTIKEAVAQALKTVPKTVSPTILLACVAHDVLYIVSLGQGRILLQRGDKLGVLLDASTDSPLHGASGKFIGNDILILETTSFAHLVPDEELYQTLQEQTIFDAAETFMPLVHEAENGDAGALFIRHFVTDEDEKEPDIIAEDEETEQEEEKEEQLAPQEHLEEKEELPVQTEPAEVVTAPEQKTNHRTLPRLSLPRLSHVRRLYLSIAVIIAVVLLVSIATALNKRSQDKLNQQFNSFFPEAQQKYSEGQQLESVNATLAQSDYQDAETLLKANQNKFPENSTERKQIDSLLTQVTSHINQTPTSAPSTDRAALHIAALNGSGTPGAAGKLGDELTSLGYTVATTGNADNYNYQGVTIKVKPDKKQYIDLLKKDLSKNHTITAATADLPSSSSEDADVIIGK